MHTIAVGRKAPQFILPSTSGGNTSLKNYRAKSNVVLFFYEKDLTPQCIRIARSFNDFLNEFDAAGTAILGVSPDDIPSHREFAARYELGFPLLTDPNLATVRKYGVYVEKGSYRREFMGIERTSFVIDKGGTIRKIIKITNIDRHAKEVLDFVRSIT